MKNSYALPLLFILICYSHNANAGDVYPKQANSLNSYEFGQFVKDYMPNANASNSWSFSTNDSKIIWDKGIERNEYTRQFQKNGYIRINFDNYSLKESPYNNPNSKAEAAWGISYYGDNTKNVDMISINHSEAAGMLSTDENEKVKPFNSLIEKNILYKPVCLYKMTGGNYSIAYELSSPNKKNIYLLETNSEGSGGLSTFYDLFNEKEKLHEYFFDVSDKNENACLII